MKVPSDINGEDLIKRVGKVFGYIKKNQKGSHCKIAKPDGTKPLTIPTHKPLKKGTLKGILEQLADYEGITVEEVMTKLGL